MGILRSDGAASSAATASSLFFCGENLYTRLPGSTASFFLLAARLRRARVGGLARQRRRNDSFSFLEKK